MNTCKTCKYWMSGSIANQCDFPFTITGGNINKDKNVTFDVFVTADDDTGLHAELITGPDFGCIHHQTKEG